MTQKAYNRRDKHLREFLKKIDHRVEMKRKAYLLSGFAIVAFNVVVAKMICS